MHQQEQTIAAHLYEKILRADYLETTVVNSVVSPRSLLNGDILLVARSPDDHLHVMVGDFTSFGVSASFAACPVAEIFYGMTRKGFAIAEILAEINKKLYKLLPVNMFLAATIIALYPDSKLLHLITCGLPEHFLVNRKNKTFKVIPSTNVPLGIQPVVEFDNKSFKVGTDDYLYLLTDGVFEAEDSAGNVMSSEAVIECIKQKGCSGLEKLKALLKTHCGEKQSHKDILYLELRCDVDEVPWRNTDKQAVEQFTQPLSWKTMLEFSSDALRKMNPVPVLVNAVMEIQGLQDYQQDIFMIITELFANALDHGVLKLDSSIKQDPDGFMQFYQQKNERLESLTEGFVRILLSHEPKKGGGGRLTIKVSDSGDGFDFVNHGKDLAANTGYAGRGIALMESLCSRLDFQGNGNSVTAVFEWEK